SGLTGAAPASLVLARRAARARTRPGPASARVASAAFGRQPGGGTERDRPPSSALASLAAQALAMAPRSSAADRLRAKGRPAFPRIATFVHSADRGGIIRKCGIRPGSAPAPTHRALRGRWCAMRLFLDLQAVQGSSRLRGIGRYSLELARALVRRAGSHEVF